MCLIKWIQRKLINRKFIKAIKDTESKFTYSYPDKRICAICKKEIPKGEKCIVEKYFRDENNLKFYCHSCCEEELRIQRLAEENVCKYCKRFREKNSAIICEEAGCTRQQSKECFEAMDKFQDEYYKIKHNIDRDWVERIERRVE